MAFQRVLARLFGIAVPPPDFVSVRLIAMDVDGVLTDGGIAWATDTDGRMVELKTFCARDGLGIALALVAGLQVAWITGRRSSIVEQRARELGVEHVLQSARDKARALGGLAGRLGVRQAGILYIGDDLNDLPAFDVAGVRVAVADASPDLCAVAHWTTKAPGGKGAVREVVEAVLRAQGRWETAVKSFLARIQAEESARRPRSGR